MDDGAAAAWGRRRTLQAHRSGPRSDRALWRIQEPRWRRHSDRHSERSRMAGAGRESAGQCHARERSKIRHESKRGGKWGDTDAKVAASFACYDVEALIDKLESAEIAFARVNDWELLSKH